MSVYGIMNKSLDTKSTKMSETLELPILKVTKSIKIADFNQHFAHNANECQDSEVEGESLHQHSEDNDVETEGALYTKIRDPPGQECVYILPGDTNKETYRMSTFMKFPEDSLINPCLLARYGFYYTGYKDRVKCFSCGSTVYDWSEHDCANDRKWHLQGCLLALGKEKTNKPISKKKLDFIGQFITEMKSLDSGYEFASSSKSETSHIIGRNSTQSSSIQNDNHSGTSQQESLSEGISEMRIEGRTNDKSKNSSSAVVSQTARVVTPPQLGPPAVVGLVFASISSSYHQELLTKTLDLHKEEDRRKSFSGWLYTFEFVTPDSLAESGFFYLGNSDRVQCFSCTGVLRNWSQNDIVDEQHQRHFPHCKMILKTESRNIPLPDTIRKPKKVRKTVSESADPNPKELEALKRQFPCLYPVNPHMREKEARLETFDRRWPSQKINATPELIVKAGFFFLGDRDRAKCWYCNGGLQNWEPNDEPFTEHAKWFPGCEYILQCKGVDFVKRIVSKFPNLRRPTLRNPRFDHKTMKLISIEPQPDQHQPQLIDPRANNNSAGNVLRSYSPTNSNSQNSAAKDDSKSKELEESAMSMGFELPLIKKVMERHIRNNGRHFPNLVELIDALVDEPPEENEVVPPANHELYENQVRGHGIAPQEVYAPLPQSLKRINDAPLKSINQEKNELSDRETLLKTNYLYKHSVTYEFVDVEPDGVLYTKIRDPPGQKCVYILPGDTEKETYRMSTFMKFPEDSPINPCLLARYGFYYTGYKDRVKCFSCGSTVYDWSEHDCANDRKWHLQGCLLALGKNKTNKPISKKRLDFIGQFITAMKSLGASNCESKSLIKTEEKIENQFTCPNPDTPTMAELEKRLETFPQNQKSSYAPNSAEAGFYHPGALTNPRCFYCKGELENLTHNHDAFEEHAKWFPGCEFLLCSKGTDFVKKILQENSKLKRRPLKKSRFEWCKNGNEWYLMKKAKQQTDDRLRVNPPNNANLSRTSPEDTDIPSTSNSVERNTTGYDSASRTLENLELERMCKLCKRKFATNLPSCGHLGLCDSCLSLANNCPVCKESFPESNPVQARTWNEVNFLNSSLRTLVEPRDNVVEDVHSVEVAAFSPSSTTLSLLTIEAELRRLEDERCCKVCWETRLDYMLLPCGHLCLCKKCVDGIRNCPACNTRILKMHKVHSRTFL